MDIRIKKEVNDMYEKIVMKYKKFTIILLIIGIIGTLSSLINKVELAYSSYKTGYYEKKAR